MPRNAEQTFAIHALSNPEIKLVTLQGVAGTGKTLLALSSAIEQAKNYKQILLARPIVPLSNKDIGYLPGDVKSKLNPYMEPLWDNLKYIKNQFKETEKGKNDMSKSEDIRFDEIERSPLPTKKPVLRDMGVDENLINEIHNQDVGDNTARDYSPIGSNIIDPEESMKSCDTHFGCGP